MKAFIIATLLTLSVQDAAPDTATVYIYKAPHARTLWRAAFPVYADEKQIATLDGGRYFIARFPPGVHTFRSKNKKQGGVEIELKAGEVYYLRMETDEGVSVGKARITTVPKEQGGYDIKQMRPIKDKDIKDRGIVDVTITEEAKKRAGR